MTELKSSKRLSTAVPTAEEYALLRKAYAETYPVRPLLNAIDAKDAEIKLLCTAGVIEVAVRNPSVADYMNHWEGRATKAEAEVERLQRYAQHGDGCPAWDAEPCTCGLGELPPIETGDPDWKTEAIGLRGECADLTLKLDRAIRNRHLCERAMDCDRLHAAFEEACGEVKMCHNKPCFCKYCREPSEATPGGGSNINQPVARGVATGATDRDDDGTDGR